MDRPGACRAERWALHLAIGLTLCAHMSSASQVGPYVRSCDARLVSVQQVCVCCCMRRGKRRILAVEVRVCVVGNRNWWARRVCSMCCREE